MRTCLASTFSYFSPFFLSDLDGKQKSPPLLNNKPRFRYTSQSRFKLPTWSRTERQGKEAKKKERSFEMGDERRNIENACVHGACLLAFCSGE